MKHGIVRHRKGCRCEICVEAYQAYQVRRQQMRLAEIRDRRRTMSTVSVEVRCPRCAGPLEITNSRHLTAEFVAVVKCPNKSCALEWIVRMTITPAHPTDDFEVGRCGTEAGYMRHVRTLNEEACDECLLAHAHRSQERSTR